jgi:hypothetical protein
MTDALILHPETFGNGHHATTPADFAQLWAHAKRAANIAAMNKNAALGPEDARGLDCGFAWLEFPGNTPFGRWAKKAGIAKKHWARGLYVWYSDLHNVPTQSVGVHEAACRAARDVLAHGLQTGEVHCASRLD